MTVCSEVMAVVVVVVVKGVRVGVVPPLPKEYDIRH